MLFKSSIASKHDLVLPLMANSDRPLLLSCIQHLKSLQQNISSELLLICPVQYKAVQCSGVVKGNKERNLIVYPFQHNDDDGQDNVEEMMVKVNHENFLQ